MASIRPFSHAHPPPDLTSPADVAPQHSDRTQLGSISPDGLLLSKNSPHARRLQLRNARFRGSKVQNSTSNRSSTATNNPTESSPAAAICESSPTPDPTGAARNLHGRRKSSLSLVDANGRSPSLFERRAGTFGEKSTSPVQRRKNSTAESISPGSILREISNCPSARNRLAGGSLFRELELVAGSDPRGNENEPPQPLLSPMRYPINTPGQSPRGDGMVPHHQRHLSSASAQAGRGGHSRKPSSLSSNVSRLRRNTLTHHRSSPSVTSDYIEHLESELAASNAKLDALTSPGTVKAQRDQLRNLKKELQSLREEVGEWEKKFEERVEDEVFERTKVEGGLRTKIRGLEEDSDAKDEQIRELEAELEKAREKLIDAESLENDLGRRVDVLAGLLAQSPTKGSFSASSHTEQNDSPRASMRPRSLFLPKPHSAKKRTESPRHRSTISVETTVRPRPFSISTDLLPQPDADASSSCPTSVRRDSELSTAITSSFPSSASSRPLSLASTCSQWSAWGLPSATLANAPYELGANCGTIKPDTRRKMRRFVNGSNSSLKPLLLPHANLGGQRQSGSSTAPVEVNPQFEQFTKSRSGSLAHSDTNRKSRSASIVQTAQFEQFGGRRDSAFRHVQAARHALEGYSPCQTPSASRPTSPFKELEDDTDLEGTLCETPGTMNRDTLSEESTKGTPSPLINSDTSSAVTTLSPPEQRNLKDELERTGEGTPGSHAVTSSISSSISSRMLSERLPNRRITPIQANLDEVMLGDMADSPCPSSATSGGRLPLPPRSVPDGSATGRYPVRPRAASHNALSSNATSAVGKTPIVHRLLEILSTLRMDPGSVSAAARRVLLRSWGAGQSGFGGLAWWLVRVVFYHNQQSLLRSGYVGRGRVQSLSIGPLGHSYLNSPVAMGRARSLSPSTVQGRMSSPIRMASSPEAASEPYTPGAGRGRGMSTSSATKISDQRSSSSHLSPARSSTALAHRSPASQSFARGRLPPRYYSNCPETCLESVFWAREMSPPRQTPTSHPAAADTATAAECVRCEEPPSKKSLRLWAKFSAALVLAVGIAVVRGPGALLETPAGSHPPPPRDADVDLALPVHGKRVSFEGSGGGRGLGIVREAEAGRPDEEDTVIVRNKAGDGDVEEDDGDDASPHRSMMSRERFDWDHLFEEI